MQSVIVGLMTLLWLIVWWLVIIDLTYCDWLHSDWLSLIYPTVTVIARWLIMIDDPTSMMVSHHTVTVGLSMMVSHRAISHSRVINNGPSVMTLLWLHCDWPSLMALLWLHYDWPSLMTLLWLTVQSVTVGSSIMVSHHAISHSRVINDDQSPYNQS
jgi:hypothetical protein